LIEPNIKSNAENGDEKMYFLFMTPKKQEHIGEFRRPFWRPFWRPFGVRLG
jgi:hypothetical protein